MNLAITKEGSRLLRWAMIPWAWRLVNKTRRWGSLYEDLKARVGVKKAIVAVAQTGVVRAGLDTEIRPEIPRRTVADSCGGSSGEEPAAPGSSPGPPPPSLFSVTLQGRELTEQM